MGLLICNSDLRRQIAGKETMRAPFSCLTSYQKIIMWLGVYLPDSPRLIIQNAFSSISNLKFYKIMLLYILPIFVSQTNYRLHVVIRTLCYFRHVHFTYTLDQKRRIPVDIVSDLVWKTQYTDNNEFNQALHTKYVLFRLQPEMHSNLSKCSWV